MCMCVHARVRDSNEQIVPLIAFYLLNGDGTDKLGMQEAQNNVTGSHETRDKTCFCPPFYLCQLF